MIIVNIQVEIMAYFYNPKEKGWQHDYDDVFLEKNVNSVKEAFWKVADEELYIDDKDIEKIWRNRNKIDNQIFSDYPKEGTFVGFTGYTTIDGDNGEKIRVKYHFTFSQIDEKPVKIE